MKELGFPRMTLNSVLGIFGPAQMPQAVVERFYHGARDKHTLRAGIGQHRQDRLCARGPVATGIWTSAAGVSADLGSDGPRDRLRSEVPASSGSAAAFDKPSKDKTGASRAINSRWPARNY